MKQMKFCLFFSLFILHQCLCQQPSQQYSQQQSTQQYGQQVSPQYTQPNQNKVQLEDIERDNLKSSQAQPQSTSQQSQSQQYLTYPQDQLLYGIQPQQAIFQTSQQSVSPSLYTAQPTTAPLVSAPQQQYFVQPYFSQPLQSYPYIDFGGFPLYPSLLPYVVPQNGAVQNGQIPSSIVGDHYKTVQPSAQVKSPQVQPAIKASPTTQVPTVGNYLLSNAIPNAYFQPVSFTQPQNPQYFAYNSFLQLQNPSKSVYSAGIKSTTPSAPVKGKEDQFVPLSNGNYRFDFAAAEQNNYNKIRLSG